MNAAPAGRCVVRRRSRHALAASVGALAIAGLAPSAAAQWTAASLHPTFASQSIAYGVSRNQQAGYIIVDGQDRAAICTGAAHTWLRMDPPLSTESRAWGVHDNQQAGYIVLSGVRLASAWSGIIGSWVNLNPAGSDESDAFAVHAGVQVGYARVDYRYRASLWSGSAESWIDLGPPNTDLSIAYGVCEGQQVGIVQVNGHNHASMWTGSAASWVDLAPANSTDSFALAVHSGQQVGFADVAGIRRASLWMGSAESWVDLRPSGASDSNVYGVSNGVQVGEALIGGRYRASLWTGSAESWVDLSSFLPAGFISSFASSVWSDDEFIYVAGGGFNADTSTNEALLWTRNRHCFDVSAPAAARACPTGSASFSVTAGGDGPFTYAWQIQVAPGEWLPLGSDPAPLPCGGSGYASPANASAVTIGLAGCTGIFAIRCVVANSCGDVTSDSAPFGVCPSDFNCDAFTDSADFFDFLVAFFGGDADFNNDAFTDSQDLFDFLASFFGGC